jgi:antitoxin FitA
VGTINVQVPDEVVAWLKQCATVRGQSLTAYIRDMLAEEAARPPVEEVMERIATRTPINYSPEFVRTARAMITPE